MSEILYLHGFNSSPQSLKARQMAAWLAEFRPDLSLSVPSLPYSPAAAIDVVSETSFSSLESYPVGIIGSSLGGYYALYLGHRFNVKTALINPAVRPFDLLKDYLGVNENLYSGEKYILNEQHMDELLALEVDTPVPPGFLYTLLQTGDQTLDYREAYELLKLQPMWIVPGGTHEFRNFPEFIPSILSHFGY